MIWLFEKLVIIYIIIHSYNFHWNTVFFFNFILSSPVSSYLFFSSTTCSFLYSSSPLTEQFGWRLLCWILLTDSFGNLKIVTNLVFYFQYMSFQNKILSTLEHLHSLVMWKNSIHCLLRRSFAVIRITRSLDLFQSPVIYKKQWKKSLRPLALMVKQQKHQTDICSWIMMNYCWWCFFLCAGAAVGEHHLSAALPETQHVCFPSPESVR